MLEYGRFFTKFEVLNIIANMVEDKKEGLAIEEEDQDVTSTDRVYDPNYIRVDQQNVNLGSLLEMMEYDEINLMPEFQRLGGLWTEVEQSQLIESVLLGLPLPSFYFGIDANTDKWVVVDGLQRLSTFRRFWIEKSLKLSGLEFLKSHEGMGVDDLPRADVRKISGFKINLYVIDKATPKSVQFLIFKRINTTGLTLTAQEMRHALHQGIPADFLVDLARLPEFLAATDHKVPTDRQQDREFVNRFLAFYMLGYQDGYQGELDAFLNDALCALDETTAEERQILKAAFRRTMEVCYNLFDNDAFRKRYSPEDARRPISKAIFDAVSVNVAWRSLAEQDTLVDRRDVLRIKLMQLFTDDSAFNQAVSTSTAKKSSVIKRFEAVKLLIEETLAL